MALILKKLVQSYFYVFDELADPRSKDMFLSGSPLPTLGLLGLYYYFIFDIGPKLMQNRPAFKLERIMLIYNLFQVIANGYIVFVCIYYLIMGNTRYTVFCTPVDYSDDPFEFFVLRMCWFYYMLKISDLLDTVFFVLRKKQNQVSFLHVYHHTGMVALGYVGTKYLGGGHSIYLGFLNAAVHTVMYSYYFLTAYSSEYKKSIWWKKYITQMQLWQFLLLALIYGQILFRPSCSYPKWACYLFVPQNFFMFLLFGDFYYKSYIKPNKKKQSDEKKVE